MSLALSPKSMMPVMLAPVVQGSAVAAINPWSMVPPLGNLDAYISAVNRLPMLTLEQEQEFSRKLKEHNDLEAAGKLVLSHLRLVVSISRKYLGYGLHYDSSSTQLTPSRALGFVDSEHFPHYDSVLFVR